MFAYFIYHFAFSGIYFFGKGLGSFWWFVFFTSTLFPHRERVEFPKRIGLHKAKPLQRPVYHINVSYGTGKRELTLCQYLIWTLIGRFTISYSTGSLVHFIFCHKIWVHLPVGRSSQKVADAESDDQLGFISWIYSRQSYWEWITPKWESHQNTVAPLILV